MKLLDDHLLVARNEEAVWEVVVAWIRAKEALGRWLVAKIQFLLMEEEYLLDHTIYRDEPWYIVQSTKRNLVYSRMAKLSRVAGFQMW